MVTPNDTLELKLGCFSPFVIDLKPASYSVPRGLGMVISYAGWGCWGMEHVYFQDEYLVKIGSRLSPP